MLEHQFKDNTGELWTINVTIKEYREIKAEFGIDVSNIISEGENWISDMMSGNDMVMFCGILWIFCSAQAEQRDISMEDFFSRLDGDSIEVATAALLEGVINFTAAPQRDSLRQIARLTKAGLDLTGKKIREKLPEVETLLTQEIEAKLDTALELQLKKLKS